MQKIRIRGLFSRFVEIEDTVSRDIVSPLGLSGGMNKSSPGLDLQADRRTVSRQA